MNQRKRRRVYLCFKWLNHFIHVHSFDPDETRPAGLTNHWSITDQWLINHWSITDQSSDQSLINHWSIVRSITNQSLIIHWSMTYQSLINHWSITNQSLINHWSTRLRSFKHKAQNQFSAGSGDTRDVTCFLFGIIVVWCSVISFLHHSRLEERKKRGSREEEERDKRGKREGK